MASNDTLQTIAGVLGNVLEWYGEYTLSVAHMICSDNIMLIICLSIHLLFAPTPLNRFWYLWILQ